MSASQPASILLVEDNLTTSRMLRLFLEREGYDVRCAYDGDQALHAFASSSFQLIVLDLMLPDLDGLAVCRSIRRTSTTPIVMLSAKTTEDDIVTGLELGADDYVCKPFGQKELLARIRRCLREPVCRDATKRVVCGPIEIEPHHHVIKLNGVPVRLTKSEFAILLTLASQPGRVYTRDQLIQAALPANYEGFERSIDTHIWSLRKKLGEPKGDPQIILSEPGIGYRMSADDET